MMARVRRVMFTIIAKLWLPLFMAILREPSCLSNFVVNTPAYEDQPRMAIRFPSGPGIEC